MNKLIPNENFISLQHKVHDTGSVACLPNIKCGVPETAENLGHNL